MMLHGKADLNEKELDYEADRKCDASRPPVDNFAVRTSVGEEHTGRPFARGRRQIPST
jgi:hypothetical protein